MVIVFCLLNVIMNFNCDLLSPFSITENLPGSSDPLNVRGGDGGARKKENSEETLS